MITVQHRFLDHQINSETETLIIGTFNPETTNNDAEFFYGRIGVRPSIVGKEHRQTIIAYFYKASFPLNIWTAIPAVQTRQSNTLAFSGSYNSPIRAASAVLTSDPADILSL